MRLFIVLMVVVCLSGALLAQSPTPLASLDEVQYFRHVFLTIGDSNYPPLRSAQIDALTKQFGLNQQELAAIVSASQSYEEAAKAMLSTFNAVLNGQESVSPGARQILRAAEAQLDLLAATLSNRILRVVRPEVADRLRAAGDLVGRALRASRGGN